MYIPSAPSVGVASARSERSSDVHSRSPVSSASVWGGLSRSSIILCFLRQRLLHLGVVCSASPSGRRLLLCFRSGSFIWASSARLLHLGDVYSWRFALVLQLVSSFHHQSLFQGYGPRRFSFYFIKTRKEQIRYHFNSPIVELVGSVEEEE